MADDCIFCQIVAGTLPAEKVYEDEAYLAFRDIQPKAPEHYLVIPKAHASRLDELAEGALGRLFLAAGRAAKAGGLDDYRLIVNVGPTAGQLVFHVHVHVLGGWAGRATEIG